MTLANLRDAVDARLVTLWGNIQTRQATYLANNGRYWQGGWTHSIAPNTRNSDANPVETAPDTAESSKPDNEPAGWGSVPGFPNLLAYRIRMDVYQGPDGWGYVGTIQVRHNGNVYERAAQVGPETWRQYGWRAVE